MTLDVTVRAADVDDRDAVAALIGSMGGHDAAGGNPRTRSMFAAAVVSPTMRGVVAVTQAGGRVVGYGEVHARPKIDRSRREAWLSVLAVDAEVRSRGIGTRLLSALDRAAATLGCDAIVVESSTWRNRAHHFYRRHGFVDLGEAQRLSHSVPAVSEEAVDGDLADRFLAAAARAASAVDAAIPGLEHAASVAIGADGAPTEAADRVAEAAICDELASLGLPIASEESGVIWPERGKPGAPNQPWVAVDPLDGSRNFRRGLPPYATAMGLVVDGLPVAGFVCDLTTGQRWWAADGRGAWRDGVRCCPQPGGVIALPSPTAGGVITVPENAERVRVSGCTTVELCRVADGAVGAFVAVDRPVVHAHDLAGPWAVLREAGCELQSADGTELQLVPDPSFTYRLTATAPARARPTPAIL